MVNEKKKQGKFLEIAHSIFGNIAKNPAKPGRLAKKLIKIETVH